VGTPGAPAGISFLIFMSSPQVPLVVARNVNRSPTTGFLTTRFPLAARCSVFLPSNTSRVSSIKRGEHLPALSVAQGLASSDEANRQDQEPHR
jgi:hypothetical protein